MKVEFELNDQDSEEVRKRILARLGADVDNGTLESLGVDPDYLVKITMECYLELLRERERERQLQHRPGGRHGMVRTMVGGRDN